MEINQSEYQTFFEQVKEAIRQARYEALRKVNKELIALYWDIGKMIVARQVQFRWGKSVVERLSKDLQKEYPGAQGYSSRNLWNMRRFYEEYRENSKLQPMVAEIGWSHNIVIIEKCKDDVEREFYIKMTRKYGWTKNVLQQIQRIQHMLQDVVEPYYIKSLISVSQFF